MSATGDFVLAVDFGTTNSLMGAAMGGERVYGIPLDPSAPDPTICRTVLYFPDPKACFYGMEAFARFAENDMAGRLFRSFKSHLPNKQYLGTMVEDRPLPLEEMVGIFLLEMRRRAEAHFDREATRVVLGRPARYAMNVESDKFAEYRMRKAAEFAGFKEIHFLAEPLAAAYQFRCTLDAEKLVLVADFGGGTSDFTIIRLRPDRFSASEDVLALDGAPVAGDALDGAVMRHRLSPLFGSKVTYRVPLGSNILSMPPAIHQRLCHPAHIVHLREPETYEFLRNAQKWAITDKDKASLERLFILMEDQQIFSLFETIEKAKRALSETGQTEIVFDYPGLEMKESATAEEFKSWTAAQTDEIFAALDRALASAGLAPESIDVVCCTGGTAKAAVVREELERRFGAEKMRTSAHFHSVLSGLVEAAGELAEGRLRAL